MTDTDLTATLTAETDQFVENIERATEAVADLNAELEYLAELQEETGYGYIERADLEPMDDDHPAFEPPEDSVADDTFGPDRG